MNASALPMEITCQDVKAMLDRSDDFLLVDCREPEEYQIANIQPAQLLPMSELADRVSEIETSRGRRLVVHCHHGGRSLQVANWLRKQGFEKAQSMSGGIDQWATDVDRSLPRY